MAPVIGLRAHYTRMEKAERDSGGRFGMSDGEDGEMETCAHLNANRREANRDYSPKGDLKRMKHLTLITVVLALFSAPRLLGQSSSGDHVEIGAFADYLNLSRTTPHINFVGVGGRAAFNVHRNVQIEAEMSYDFARNFTSSFSNGVTTQFVQTKLRPLQAMFGPKFETNAGPLRAFGTFKVGFVNFSTSNQNAPSGFTGALNGVTAGGTRPAIYPGLGVEGFWGPFGLRLDGGDEIYFDNGTRNNLKITFGPVLRF